MASLAFAGARNDDPDARYWGREALEKRGFAAERGDEGAAAGADEATVLKQGKSGTCVRHALASAIEDQVERKTKIKLEPHGIVAGLMQRLEHAKGTYPMAFDGFAFNAGDETGLWYTLKVSVKNSTEKVAKLAKKGFPIFGLPGSSQDARESQAQAEREQICIISHNCHRKITRNSQRHHSHAPVAALLPARMKQSSPASSPTSPPGCTKDALVAGTACTFLIWTGPP